MPSNCDTCPLGETSENLLYLKVCLVALGNCFDVIFPHLVEICFMIFLWFKNCCMYLLTKSTSMKNIKFIASKIKEMLFQFTAFIIGFT